MSEFLKILVLTLFAFTAIFVMIHLMDHIDLYLDQDAPWSAVGKYYLYQTPYNLLLTLPMAMLVATILSIGDLGRHGELTAMKSSGLSLYRITLPVVLFSLLVSLAGLVFGETWIPVLNARVNDVYEEEIIGEGPRRDNYRGNFVYQNEAGYTYIVRALFVDEADTNTAGASADQVEIQRQFEDGTFLRINAPQMVWEPRTETWVLQRGEMRLFPAAGDERMFTFSLLRSPDLVDRPEELLAEDKEPEEMGYADLESYIAKRRRLGADTLEEEVDLQMKLSYPFANLIIVLFGVALVGSAAHTSRHAGATGFGIALFLTIVFWGFLRVGQGIGYGGGLGPVWAAWLANGVFLVVALILLSRART
jgi:lipopolysaccharide export system permease protein